MIVLLPFAFLAGIVTILSPCILPVLPIVLSGSVGGRSRPYGVITGFVVSFSLFTLVLSSLVQILGIPPNALRVAAVVTILAFGLVMLVPKFRDVFELAISKIANKRGGGQRGCQRDSEQTQSKGFFGGLIVGFSLGLVWTPCVGPIIASVISLAITQSIDGGAVLIILTYSIGTSIPMLAIILGGKSLLKRIPVLSRNPAAVQRVFGVLMILMAVAIGFEWDRKFQAGILRVFPNYGAGLTAFENIDSIQKVLDTRSGSGSETTIDASMQVLTDLTLHENNLGEYGLAPEIVTDGQWFNLEGLGIDVTEDQRISMEDLRGKVVLLDFWTYSCINCVRTLPYLRSWYDKYHQEGFILLAG